MTGTQRGKSRTDPREVARSHVLPGGRLTDEAHRSLARLAEATDAARCPDCQRPREFCCCDDTDMGPGQ